MTRPSALVALALALLAGCADGPSAPLAAPSTAPSAAMAPKNVFSITTVGDTTVAQIALVPGGRGASYFIGGNQHLDLPGGAEIVCDLQTSSYGAGTWDSACVPETEPLTITARSWTDASGAAHTEFSPALRFVPSQVVQLSLNSRSGIDVSRQKIAYCTTTADCIDESLADPSVATRVLSGTQLTRRVKHFSGYNVVVDRDGGGSFDGF